MMRAEARRRHTIGDGDITWLKNNKKPNKKSEMATFGRFWRALVWPIECFTFSTARVDDYRSPRPNSVYSGDAESHPPRTKSALYCRDWLTDWIPPIRRFSDYFLCCPRAQGMIGERIGW
jgi:hypothetical protein